ncbi:MAG TPA: molecular chaperone DnaJ [Desulfobacteraceae bacterium]|nr:molecular chaperone DnaJ [Desulfobacteraceae bacterium]HPJ67767.1 molecular chaperone DnaJ [Desulfobacteraceae bacterium]
MPEDFYKILGVPKDAPQSDIKKAYRKLARKWHPDINPGNKEAEQKFKEISHAHDCLANEEKRKLYDEFGEDGLRSGFDAEKAREYKKWETFQQEGQSQRDQQDFGRYQNYEDIFGDIFGSGMGREGFRGSTVSRGRDVEYGMDIDFVSALKGFSTEISMQKLKPCTSCNGSGTDPNARMSTCQMCGGSGRLNMAEGPMHFTRPCPQCKGHGQTGKACAQCGGSGQVLGTEKIRVTIPKGVKEGSRVRVAGKGEPGMNGGKPGDLYLVVHIKPHPFLRREGDNIFMEVPVTVREAMAGGEITIPTVDGQINLKVPPKSQSGQTLRLKGRGAENPRTKKKGDLMVRISVKVPQTDEKEVLKSVEQMDKLYKKDLRADLRL